MELKPHTRVKFSIEAKRRGKEPEAVDVEVMQESTTKSEALE